MPIGKLRPPNNKKAAIKAAKPAIMSISVRVMAERLNRKMLPPFVYKGNANYFRLFII